MGKQLVFSKNGNIYLNTCMTQRAFAQSKLTQRLNEKGWLVQKDGGRWTFSPWSFTGTKAAEEEDAVLLEGFAFSGLTLKALFDDHDKAKQAFAGAFVCTAIEAALEQNIQLKDMGAGGAVVSADFTRIVFLPKDLFETAMQCAGAEDYSAYEGQYINKTLTKNAALQFTQAVIAYRLLTGDLPFPETDTDRREEDYRDRNYLPLAGRVWALDEGLSVFVDNALQRKPASKDGNIDAKITRIIQESNAQDGGMADRRAGMRFPLTALYRELGLTEDGGIPQDGQLMPVIHKARVSQEQFEAAAERRQEKFRRALGRKRWLRRNRTLLSITATAATVTVIIAGILIHGSFQQPTTRGLSAARTVEMYYSAVNNLDVTAVKASTKGRDFKGVMDVISNFYVTSKSRSVYDYKKKTVTPAEWLSFNFDGNYTIYGLSQFVIGEDKSSLYFSAPAKKDFPMPVTEEGGIPLKDGITKTLRTSYFLVYNEDPDTLTVIPREDRLTLSYKGKRWTITGMTQYEAEPRALSYPAFLADYTAAMERAEAQGNGILQAAAELRERYPWVPTTSEILEAADKMQRENGYVGGDFSTN